MKTYFSLLDATRFFAAFWVMNFVILKFDNISWSHLSIGFEVVIIFVAYVVYLQDIKLRGWLKKKLF